AKGGAVYSRLMAGHCLTRTLLDSLSDELAYRSGLLLSMREVREVAVHVPDEDFRSVLLGDLDDLVERASDIYSALARALRVAIGNLPDDQPAITRRKHMMMSLLAEGYDPASVMAALVDASSDHKGIGEEAVSVAQRRTGVPRE